MNVDYNEALNIVPKSFFSLVILFLITKVIGKKQVSELSLFDYVIGISIGNFAAEMVMDVEGQYINGIIAILVFGFTAYLVSLITMKSIKLRRLLIGVPSIIIQNGKICVKNLKKARMNINDVLEQCRTAGYFDLSEIEYATLEANGNLSILPKSENKPLTPKDMNIKTQKESLTANIIIDGKLLEDNIKHTKQNIKWIKQQLKIKGYESYDDIILATLKDDDLTIYTKDAVKKIEKVLE